MSAARPVTSTPLRISRSRSSVGEPLRGVAGRHRQPERRLAGPHEAGDRERRPRPAAVRTRRRVACAAVVTVRFTSGRSCAKSSTASVAGCALARPRPDGHRHAVLGGVERAEERARRVAEVLPGPGRAGRGSSMASSSPITRPSIRFRPGALSASTQTCRLSPARPSGVGSPEPVDDQVAGEHAVDDRSGGAHRRREACSPSPPRRPPRRR